MDFKLHHYALAQMLTAQRRKPNLPCTIQGSWPVLLSVLPSLYCQAERVRAVAIPARFRANENNSGLCFPLQPRDNSREAFEGDKKDKGASCHECSPG